ncbi:HyaD/HybD family hydrogenase maturation endopeptidase [Pectinatus haikarae]|uniref:HyaD/HybD family hydrogenase maturation endopeptidase n=1 Tax=Pectinatus haikarae TaxID=349096 RepID=UPI0018C79F1E|nr:HyaD/HybD family hydrogenase maturation endopeptidase [Pectinatus haikarae]
MDNVTILGVGNILMQDDGFGVRLIEKLQLMKWPEKVRILDGGTLGMLLLPYIEGTKKLLIVDAINAPGTAGDFFCFEGSEVNAYFSNKISVHDLGINDLLAALAITNDPVDETVVMGIKPAVVDLGMELTEIIEEKMDKTIEKVLSHLKKWHVFPV